MMRRLLGSLLVLAALAGCAPTAPPTVEIVSGQLNSIEVGGVSRSYTVQAPVDAAEPLPLLIVLHGASGNGEIMERDTGLTDYVDGFIVAYPNGTLRTSAENDLAWNAGRCCGRASDNQVDDVAFLDAMIADVETAYPVDPARIYVAGFSNGGMMAYRLACAPDSPFAGIAVVSGSFNADDCVSPSSMSVIIFHGTSDSVLPYEGSANPIMKTSVPDTAAFWAGVNGCAADPVSTADRTLSLETYSDCDHGTAVQLVAIDGGTHVWPRAGAGDASSLILDFFALG